MLAGNKRNALSEALVAFAPDEGEELSVKMKLLLITISLTLLSCQEHTMHKTDQLYTLGNWTAKPGYEKQFIAEWEAFARWTARNQPGAGAGYLLQDPEHPRQFVSFGPWDNADAIKAWRERPEFKAFVLKIRGLCDDFQPRTLVPVASSAQ